MKVIIATDSSKLNEYFSIQFIEEGVEPSKALSAEEINTAIEKKQIDSVLIDIDSNNYKGLDTVKELKEKHKDLILIIMTSNTGVDFFKEISEIGVFGLVSKIDDMESQFSNLIAIIDDLKRRKDEKRQHIRVKPSAAQHNFFSLKIKGLTKDYQGQVEDISRGGVALTFSEPPPESLLFKGKEVELNIELGGVTLKARGNVVLRTGMNTTVLFQELSDSNKRRIFEYILSRIDE
ncbi:MAG: response regulator [Spirochaetota bacterium]|nr:response regulator [Spirochaetota bacterium]